MSIGKVIVVEDVAIEAISHDDLVMVSLEDLDEGLHGDVDTDDKNDVSLLRFTLYRKYDSSLSVDQLSSVCEGDEYEDGDWMSVRNGSYCTQVPANTPQDQQEAIALFLLEQVYEDLKNMKYDKRKYQSLSWVHIKDGQPFCPTQQVD